MKDGAGTASELDLGALRGHDPLILGLVTVVTVETIVGGSGRLLVVGAVTARTIIFGIFVMTFLIMALTFPGRLRKLAWIFSASIAGWLIVYGLVGLLNGAVPSAVVANSNSFVTLTYAILFYYFFTRYPNGLEVFLRLVEWSALAIALFTLGTLVASKLGMLDLRDLDEILKARGYGGNTGVKGGIVPRVYFISQIYLQIALALVLARMLLPGASAAGRRGADLIKLFILLSALVITFTRGFWLGALVAAGIVLYLAGFRRAVKQAVAGLAVIAVIVAALIATGVYDSSDLAQRFVSTTDVEENQSNLVRVLEAREVAKQVRSSPIIGVGFGVVLPDSYYRLREQITGKPLEGDEFVIELSYFDLLRKVGVVGFGLFLWGLWILVSRMWKAVRSEPDSKRRAMLAGCVAGFVSFLVAAGTNPYLTASAGLFLFSVAIAVALAYSDSSSARPVT